jgi:hypothetical protein
VSLSLVLEPTVGALLLHLRLDVFLNFLRLPSVIYQSPDAWLPWIRRRNLPGFFVYGHVLLHWSQDDLFLILLERNEQSGHPLQFGHLASGVLPNSTISWNLASFSKKVLTWKTVCTSGASSVDLVMLVDSVG